MIQTTIHGGPNIARHDGTALAEIRSSLQPGATYTKLTARGGAKSVTVIGTKEGEAPRSVESLARMTPPTSAVINGGYFVHKTELKIDGKVDGAAAQTHDLGRPVGPTTARSDHVPVARVWEHDYGYVLNAQGEVALTSGPTLALNGHPAALGPDDRFQYRISGTENPLNALAGALTHASDANERAAISLLRDESNAPSHTVFHALTTDGQRNLGATMEEWQTITGAGADPSGTRAGAAASNQFSTLNLDGGGSVFLGIRDEQGVTQIVRGGVPAESLRPVANVIATQSSGD